MFTTREQIYSLSIHNQQYPLFQIKRIICELIILTANWLSAKWFTILCELGRKALTSPFRIHVYPVLNNRHYSAILYVTLNPRNDATTSPKIYSIYGLTPKKSIKKYKMSSQLFFSYFKTPKQSPVDKVFMSLIRLKVQIQKRCWHYLCGKPLTVFVHNSVRFYLILGHTIIPLV